MTRENLYYTQMHLAGQSWREHRGLGHMRELLARSLPAGAAPDRRGWEWFYLRALPHQGVRPLVEAGRAGGSRPSRGTPPATDSPRGRRPA